MLQRSTTRVLALLCVMYFITYVDRVNVSTAAIQFSKEFHLSNTQVGLLFSAFAYPYLLFQVFGGWVGDRFGPRRTLTICSMIWAGATVLTGLSTGLVTMFIARLLLGLGEGATFPTATRAMSNWTAANRRGFAQGITHAFSRIGNAVTPPIVTWLMVALSWRWSFIILGVVSFIWAVVWGWYFRDNPRDHAKITTAEVEILPAYVGRKETPAVPWAALIARMAPVTLVYFCYGWTLWLFLTWIPQYFLHNYQMNLKNSALFSSGVFLAGVLGDTLGGHVTDRLLARTQNRTKARSYMVVVCNTLTLASLLPILFVHDSTVAAICLSLGFFFAEMTIGPMWAIPMDIAPKYSGTASGLMNIGSALAAILSPVVGGWIIDSTGNWDLPFIGSMGLMVVGAVCAFAMKPDQKF
ncbi:MAG TPA: MFS transporter [Steroidobacteraceae bacterium]|nr:MFS transporter [Steroidobacteraceae bacterium]